MHTTNNKFKAVKLAVAALVGGASALAAMPAMADTNVTVSGLVDTYVGSQKYSGDSAASSIVGAGGMTTSWWGFSGTEDLGDGLQANFKLTSFFRSNNGAIGRFDGNETMFSRDAHVGLSGAFGAISVGRDLAPNFLPSILFNPFGDSFQFSPLIMHMDVPVFNASNWANTTAGDTGWSNELMYTTPDFSGLKANLHYQFGGVAGQTGKNNIGANVLYFHGPLALTAFYQRVDINNPLPGEVGNVQQATDGEGPFAPSQKAWFLGASYDLNFAKLFATYQQTTNDGIDWKDKTLQLGTSIPFGHGAILASWAGTKRTGTDISAPLGESSIKRNTATVGYDYNLSKRTDVYANYMYDKITDENSGGSVGVGIRHRF